MNKSLIMAMMIPYLDPRFGPMGQERRYPVAGYDRPYTLDEHIVMGRDAPKPKPAPKFKRRQKSKKRSRS